MRKTYDATAKWAFDFCNPFLASKIRRWIVPAMTALWLTALGFVHRHFVWAVSFTVFFWGVAILIAALYARGEQLIKSELTTGEIKRMAIKDAQKQADTRRAADDLHKQAMKKIQARGISTRKKPLK